jgi:parallel beta-helix repeat protein
VVVYYSGFDDSVTAIAGFTIRHGRSDWGGGIVCDAGRPTIKNNFIYDNIYDGWGLSSSGAGILCRDSDALIADNIVSYNSINNDELYGANGGGIACSGANPKIINNTISNNTAQDEGGGIYISIGTNPEIIDNYIANNQAEYGGGIGYEGVRAGCIYSNYIYNNSDDGIYARSCTMSGNIIVANSGSGIYCHDYENETTLINNIIYNNQSDDGAGVFCDWSNPSIVNCIVFGNTPGNIAIDNMGFGDPVVSYSNIGDGWEGVGNISIAPLFRDPDNGDYHLMAIVCGDPYDSPCIDAGDPSLIDTLLDCDWGLGTARSDIGAHGGGEGFVDVDEPAENLPTKVSLSQNYPNPFNISTMIKYELPTQSRVKIDIYDILGRRVATLEDAVEPAGYHQLIWNAEGVSSGVYLYKLQAGDYIETRKMMLIK